MKREVKKYLFVRHKLETALNFDFFVYKK